MIYKSNQYRIVYFLVEPISTVIQSEKTWCSYSFLAKENRNAQLHLVPAVPVNSSHILKMHWAEMTPTFVGKPTQYSILTKSGGMIGKRIL